MIENRYHEGVNPKYIVDLGSDHVLFFHGWSPDRDINPQYEGIPDVEYFGASIEHKNPQGGVCVGAVNFRGDVQRKLGVNENQMWDVLSMDPLTLDPSVLCGCGDHGFVREGRWVAA